MREDMKDVIIDTGRYGGRYSKSPYSRASIRRADPEDLPNRLPTGRHRLYGYDSKEPGDRLAPLRGYLNANVGRPWADIWHEICEHADARTIRGYHLRQHVWFEVGRNKWGYGDLFIDDDGTLQKAKERQSRWHNFEPTVKLQYEGEPDIYYQKIEGFWYEFKTTHTTQPCSHEDLVTVDGEVKIVRIPLPDVVHHETVKHQVDGDTAAKLDADADKIDAKWLRG